MSPYQKFLAAVKEFFSSHPALKVVFSLYLVIFAAGGFFFLLGTFFIGGWGEMSICIGTFLMLIGLLLTLFNEDMMALVFTSGVIALVSLVSWVLNLVGVLYVGGYGYVYINFTLTPLFYAGLFGFVAIITSIKSKKFHASFSAMGKPSGVPCPKCGATIVPGAAFCPQCGAPAPAPVQYAPPVPPQYGAPYAPQPAPQAAPQYAPPVPPQPVYAPQPAPQYAPPVPPQYAPQPAPQPVPQPVAPEASEPALSEPAATDSAPATKPCVNCGAELPAGAMFCGKCGSKQQ